MSRPIRILHVLQRMEAGGTQALLMSIYRNIDRSKIQFDFLVEYPDKQFYDDEIVSLGGKIYYTSVRKDFNVLKFKSKLKQIIKFNDYKIVHVHAYTIGYFVLKTAKKCGVSVRIAHSHNAETVRDKKYLFKKFMQKIYTIHATDLLACSEKAGEYLYKNKPFNVIRNTIQSNNFVFNAENRNELRKELCLEKSFVVGHTGRFHEQKNHMFLIDVFCEIKKMKPNSKLLLIGSGDLEEKILLKIKKLNLSADVIILKNRKDMNKLYQAMDIFIFPSLFEGLSVAALEVQASGTPILCSDALSDEHNITPLIKQISLEESPKKWAIEAIKLSSNKFSHKDMKEYIIKAGLDVVEVSNKIQEYYIDMYNRI